jgi:hypothetical protein
MCPKRALTLAATLAALAPAAARAQACCAAPSVAAPARLGRDEQFGLGLSARMRGVYGGFAPSGAFASTADGDVETTQELFGVVQAAGRAQVAVVLPFVETRRSAPGLVDWGGGVGDVRASGRVEILRGGVWRYVPGLSLLAGVTLPTGTPPEQAAGPLAAGATGTGTFAAAIGLELERRWERAFGTLAVSVAQRAPRAVGPIRQGFSPELSALASGGLVLSNDVALGAFVTGSREGASHDAMTGAAIAGSELALLTAGLGAVVPFEGGWRGQALLSADCPIAGLGRNRTAGAGLGVSILRFWQ